MDEVTELKLRIMSLEQAQRKTNKFLITVCSSFIKKKSQMDSDVIKAMEKFLNNFNE